MTNEEKLKAIQDVALHNLSIPLAEQIAKQANMMEAVLGEKEGLLTTEILIHEVMAVLLHNLAVLQLVKYGSNDLLTDKILPNFIKRFKDPKFADLAANQVLDMLEGKALARSILEGLGIKRKKK